MYIANVTKAFLSIAVLLPSWGGESCPRRGEVSHPDVKARTLPCSWDMVGRNYLSRHIYMYIYLYIIIIYVYIYIYNNICIYIYGTPPQDLPFQPYIQIQTIYYTTTPGFWDVCGKPSLTFQVIYNMYIIVCRYNIVYPVLPNAKRWRFLGGRAGYIYI